MKRIAGLLVVMLIGLVVATQDRAQLPPPPTSASAATDNIDRSPNAPLVMLDSIPAAGKLPVRDYERNEFGGGWGTTKGCDTRNRLLARDLVEKSFKPGTRRCVVTAGTLTDPYSGDIITYTKGDPSSMAVQIDHRLSVPSTG